MIAFDLWASKSNRITIKDKQTTDSKYNKFNIYIFRISHWNWYIEKISDKFQTKAKIDFTLFKIDEKLHTWTCLHLKFSQFIRIKKKKTKFQRYVSQ